MARTPIMVITYNVQAPFLSSEARGTITKDERWLYVWRAIFNAIAATKKPVFVCLQEVCASWLDRFQDEMAGIGFLSIVHDYSPLISGQGKPLYTVIFYMTSLFICQPLEPVLTGSASNDQKERLCLTSHAVATNGRKCNAIHSGLFTSTGGRGGPPRGKQIVVATYHAPCAHWYPPSQALHFENALTFLAKQTVPAVLAGDMNTKPTDCAYRLVSGVRDFMFSLFEKHLNTSCSPLMEPSCLDYVFGNKFVQPELIRVQSFCEKNSLSETQPSDHGVVVASFSM